MAPSRDDLFRLRCKVQHYEWGLKGHRSEVGKLYSLMTGEKVDDSLPYAELWMGTHDSGPSFVLLDMVDQKQLLLKDWLEQHPEALGEKVIQRWKGDLPFLFKVLSVGKALSIQAHPDKKLAEKLHASQPHIYKDANHKPEVALALTEFGALCGFVTMQELRLVLTTVPELSDALGTEVVEDVLSLVEYEGEDAKLVLQRAFTVLMNLNQKTVEDTLSNLLCRLLQKKKGEGLTEKEELILNLESQYPDDVGVLSAYFLNFVKLEPGKAVFMDANEPHAYLYGECVECMATSDNVVRAGLTPKYRDTQTLCSMLTYKQGSPNVWAGTFVDLHTRRYSPPTDEFEVDQITLPVGEIMSIPAIPGPSILLVYDGIGIINGASEYGTSLKKGDVLFLVAGKQISISCVTGELPLIIYRAGVNSRVL